MKIARIALIFISAIIAFSVTVGAWGQRGRGGGPQPQSPCRSYTYLRIVFYAPEYFRVLKKN